MSARGDGRARRMRQLFREIEGKGWTVERTNGGHMKLTPPCKDVPAIICSDTPSDWRARLNLRSDIQRVEKQMQAMQMTKEAPQDSTAAFHVSRVSVTNDIRTRSRRLSIYVNHTLAAHFNGRAQIKFDVSDDGLVVVTVAPAAGRNAGFKVSVPTGYSKFSRIQATIPTDLRVAHGAHRCPEVSYRGEAMIFSLPLEGVRVPEQAEPNNILAIAAPPASAAIPADPIQDVRDALTLLNDAIEASASVHASVHVFQEDGKVRAKVMTERVL